MKATFILPIAAWSSAAVLIAGCHGRRTYYQGPSIDGFRFGAHASIVGPRGDTLRVTATAENASNNQLQEEHGTCYGLNRLALVAQGDSKTWDSRTWELRQQPIYRDATGRVMAPVCVGGLLNTTVPPGGLLSYELRVPIGQILGDSLVPGRYRITARIAINGREIKNLRAGEVNFGTLSSRVHR